MQVYLVTNTVNGKRYVGQTVRTLKQRWKEHIRDSKDISKTHFHNAIRKYGPENFLLKTLVWCKNTDEMDTKEKHYISSMKTLRPDGYNLTTGGDGSFGYKHTEKSLRKMRRIQKANPTLGMLGKKHSKETRELLSKLAYSRTPRKPCSKETRAKISKSKLGKKRKPFSKKWIANLAKAHKGLVYKTHCKRGHLRTADSVSSTGACKKCMNQLAREAYHRKKR